MGPTLSHEEQTKPSILSLLSMGHIFHLPLDNLHLGLSGLSAYTDGQIHNSNLSDLHHRFFLAVKADLCAYVFQGLGIAPPSQDKQANFNQP